MSMPQGWVPASQRLRDAGFPHIDGVDPAIFKDPKNPGQLKRGKPTSAMRAQAPLIIAWAQQHAAPAGGAPAAGNEAAGDGEEAAAEGAAEGEGEEDSSESSSSGGSEAGGNGEDSESSSSSEEDSKAEGSNESNQEVSGEGNKLCKLDSHSFITHSKLPLPLCNHAGDGCSCPAR